LLKTDLNPSFHQPSPPHQYIVARDKPTAEEAPTWPTTPGGAFTIVREAPESPLIIAKLQLKDVDVASLL
jgi:hypothetical protein